MLQYDVGCLWAWLYDLLRLTPYQSQQILYVAADSVLHARPEWFTLRRYILFHVRLADVLGCFPGDGTVQGQTQHSNDVFPSLYTPNTCCCRRCALYHVAIPILW